LRSSGQTTSPATDDYNCFLALRFLIRVQTPLYFTGKTCEIKLQFFGSNVAFLLLLLATITGMELMLAIGVLVLACVFLYAAGELLVAGLLRLAWYFQVTEFVVAFFVMAFAASLPNLLVGINSAMQGIPELSFGDIMGNNILALTVAVAVGVFFAPRRELPLENQTIQDSTFLTAIAAILPLILVSDGMISRSDGVVLLLFFFGYVYWLFSKQDRFTRVYDINGDAPNPTRTEAWQALAKVLLGVTMLAISAQGVVYGGLHLALAIEMPLLLVGILVIGFGGALPEIYFTYITARRGETGMIVGNLMGAVIIPVTFVLGLVAIISPIYNNALEFSFISRVFLVLIALYFFIVSKTSHAISFRESIVLCMIYAGFFVSLVWVW